jgi:hypothetical protein
MSVKFIENAWNGGVGSAGISLAYTTDECAQYFIAPDNYTLDKIILALSDYQGYAWTAPPWTISVSFYDADVNKKPTGSPLAGGTGSITAPETPDGSGSLPVIKSTLLLTPLTLVSGNAYCFVCTIDSNYLTGSAKFWQVWRYTYAGVGGSDNNKNAFSSPDSGVNWTALDVGIEYELYGNILPDPSNNQIVTGLRHIYNRKRYDLEISYGGVSVVDDLVTPEQALIAEDLLTQAPVKKEPVKPAVVPETAPEPEVVKSIFDEEIEKKK